MRAVGIKVLKNPLSEYVRLGWLRPAVRRFNAPPPSIPVATWAELEAELAEDRSDHFASSAPSADHR